MYIYIFDFQFVIRMNGMENIGIPVFFFFLNKRTNIHGNVRGGTSRPLKYSSRIFTMLIPRNESGNSR